MFLLWKYAAAPDAGDLAFFFPSNGYSVLSVIVDVFSRKTYVMPLKSKHSEEVKKAIQAVIDDGLVIQTLYTDQVSLVEHALAGKA